MTLRFFRYIGSVREGVAISNEVKIVSEGFFDLPMNILDGLTHLEDMFE
jgi:hypothetical protein